MANKTINTVLQSTERAFVITRVFNAPLEKVWKAWTNPEELKKWFGPKGYTMPECKMDLRPGGTFLYCLKSPEGMELWGKWVFEEISKPTRIDLIMSFSDKDGGLTRHPLSSTWPLKTKSATTFSEAGGKTTVTQWWAAYEATEKEQKTFDDSHADMTQGWSGTFEQLADYLAKA